MASSNTKLTTGAHTGANYGAIQHSPAPTNSGTKTTEKVRQWLTNKLPHIWKK